MIVWGPMKAKISNRVGGVKVHKRPASAILVEPDELWPGYEVTVQGHYQGKQHLWTKIYYIYNGNPYIGWVIDSALDLVREPPFPPPDVEVPVPDTNLFRPGYWDTLLAAGITAIIAAVLSGLLWLFLY